MLLAAERSRPALFFLVPNRLCRHRTFALRLNTIPTLAWSLVRTALLISSISAGSTIPAFRPNRRVIWRLERLPFTRTRPGPDLSITASVLASGETGEIEARLRRFDGVYRWFLFRATPSFDHDGRVVKWFGTNTDIEDENARMPGRRRESRPGDDCQGQFAGIHSPKPYGRVVERTSSGSCCSINLDRITVARTSAGSCAEPPSTITTGFRHTGDREGGTLNPRQRAARHNDRVGRGFPANCPGSHLQDVILSGDQAFRAFSVFDSVLVPNHLTTFHRGRTTESQRKRNQRYTTPIERRSVLQSSPVSQNQDRLPVIDKSSRSSGEGQRPAQSRACSAKGRYTSSQR